MLSQLIYTIGIRSYYLLIQFASLFNGKARLFVQGRKRLFQKLQRDFQNETAPIAWFHCASLGEFEQGRPVIEGFKKEYPNFKILLTFFSPSGYEVRKNYSNAEFIYYLPIDTKKNANQLCEIVQPKIAFFVKYEFWHFYISELHQRNIPCISFSAIFRSNSIFFKSYGDFYRKILSKFHTIWVQNEESKKLLQKISIHQVKKAGDTRFDRVFQIVENRKSIPIVEKFKNSTFTLVIGSSWDSDLKVIAPILEKWLPKIKIIIAPHEISEGSLVKTESYFPKDQTVRFSKFDSDFSKQNVLIIDNIGMLSSLYFYADVTYVGGAFGSGLHNILEAATYGKPIIFGGKYQKFQEAKDLVSKQGAFSIQNTKEFQTIFEKLFSDKLYRQSVGAITKSYVKSNLGAAAQILSEVKSILSHY